MPAPAEIAFDVASAIIRGKREYQEDALASDFQVGSDFGFVVLSDGMGGHAAGDVASNIVVTEVFSELKLRGLDAHKPADGITGILSNAAHSANQCIRDHTSANPATTGMGATLIAPVLAKDKLYWVSVGDSPLYLFRDNKLSQLNQDHSLAPQIDCMVRSGMMSESDGRNHPDRNCLTSALLGEDIPQIDCPENPVTLRPGDLVIAASDGLQYLSDAQITGILAKRTGVDSATIAERLLSEIAELDDPHQDNVCFTVIRVLDPKAQTAGRQKRRANGKRPRPESAGPAEPKTPKPERSPVAALSNVLGRLRFLYTGLLR